MNTKLIGTLMRALGCGLLFAAYMMDTSVETSSGAVYNIGLLSQQNNLTLLGALFLIAGIFIYVLAKKEPKKEQTNAEIEEDLKAGRESNELEQRRTADKALYVQSGKKAFDCLSGIDLTIFWSPLILAALLSDQAWWKSGFLVFLSFLFGAYKFDFYRKKIIAEMKAKNNEPIESSEN